MLEDAKSLMVSTLQGIFNETNKGSVIGNGITFYSTNQMMYTLNDMNGIMGEHFASFESVN